MEPASRSERGHGLVPPELSSQQPGWASIPLELRLKIFCLAARENKTVLAAFNRVCREWRSQVGPLFNLSRLNAFTKALLPSIRPKPVPPMEELDTAGMQFFLSLPLAMQPKLTNTQEESEPASILVQEALQRMASSLENPDANHQGAFIAEWIRVSDITALERVAPILFERYRFSDLKECICLKNKLRNVTHSWITQDLVLLAKLYTGAGAWDEAEKTIRLINSNRDEKQFEHSISSFFYALIVSNQWGRVKACVTTLRLSKDHLDTICYQVLELCLAEKKLLSALTALQLLDDDMITGSDLLEKRWKRSCSLKLSDLLLSLADLLVDAGRGNLITKIVPKIRSHVNDFRLNNLFSKWAVQNRGQQPIPPLEEIQAVTHFLFTSKSHECLLDWINLLVDFTQYSQALAILKKIDPRWSAPKYAATLNRLAVCLKCDVKSVAYAGLSFTKRLQLIEVALNPTNPTASPAVAKPIKSSRPDD